MTTPTDENIALATASEALRQQSETFNQLKQQDRRWHVQRLAMGWMAFVTLPLIAALCGWVILSHREFSDETVTAATVALLVDVLGLVGSVWRGVLGKGPAPLSPVTGLGGPNSA